MKKVVAKFPRLHQGKPGFTQMSEYVFSEEVQKLQNFRIARPDLMQIYAITDKLILFEYYPLGSLENYIEKGGKPDPLDYATQLCRDFYICMA